MLPIAQSWLEQGEPCVLVTLVGIDGSWPRRLGSQMVITQSGKIAGHISSGCLNHEIRHQALTALQEKKNRCIRYGKGSKYFDIVLPCGSGIDLYFDQSITAPLLADTILSAEKRQPFSLLTDLNTGITKQTELRDIPAQKIKTERIREGENDLFERVYEPETRLVIYGSGLALETFAQLAATTNWQTEIYTPDAETRDALNSQGIPSFEYNRSHNEAPPEFDKWTAAVLLFHDHDWELPILKFILKSDCFYIGAQGSLRTHNDRLSALKAEGVSDKELQRLKGPMGLVQQTKSPVELAISTFAEIITCAE